MNNTQDYSYSETACKILDLCSKIFYTSPYTLQYVRSDIFLNNTFKSIDKLLDKYFSENGINYPKNVSIKCDYFQIAYIYGCILRHQDHIHYIKLLKLGVFSFELKLKIQADMQLKVLENDIIEKYLQLKSFVRKL